LISHFQLKEIDTGKRFLKAYEFSFFFQGGHFRGYYHPNGKIDWYDPAPPDEAIQRLQSQVHELMLFHVYEK